MRKFVLKKFNQHRMPIRILLYEDNSDLRNSLSALINFSADMELVAAFENCAEVHNHLTIFEPDVVLMDIDMPVMNGIRGLEIIRKMNANIPVIMLTIFDDSKHILEAIMNGASGYILKQNLTTHLANAVQEALEGGAPMSPVVAQLVLKYISNQKTAKNNYKLTNREKEILQLLTDGNSYKMIAANLGITMGTVISHITNIYEKLDVHSQAEAISKTFRENIL